MFFGVLPFIKTKILTKKGDRQYRARQLCWQSAGTFIRRSLVRIYLQSIQKSFKNLPSQFPLWFILIFVQSDDKNWSRPNGRFSPAEHLHFYNTLAKFCLLHLPVHVLPVQFGSHEQWQGSSMNVPPFSQVRKQSESNNKYKAIIQTDNENQFMKKYTYIVKWSSSPNVPKQLIEIISCNCVFVFV